MGKRKGRKRASKKRRQRSKKAAQIRASEPKPDVKANPEAEPEPEPEPETALPTPGPEPETAPPTPEPEPELPPEPKPETASPTPLRATAPARKKQRGRRRRPKRPPPRGFWLGFLFGLVALIPGFALCALAMTRLELIADREFETLLGLSVAFVGLPGAVTAGGVGRVAVRAVVFGRSLRSASLGAGLRLGVGGCALAALLAIASGPTPDAHRWWLIALLGSATGVISGLLLGALAGVIGRTWLREEEIESTGPANTSEAN